MNTKKYLLIEQVLILPGDITLTLIATTKKRPSFPLNAEARKDVIWFSGNLVFRISLKIILKSIKEYADYQPVMILWECKELLDRRIQRQ